MSVPPEGRTVPPLRGEQGKGGTPAFVPPPPRMGGPRHPAFGMPLEKSKDFGGTLRRLVGHLRPDAARLVLVVALSLTAVSLTVLGPRLLGHATDLVVGGLITGGIDFGALHRTLFEVVAVYLVAGSLNYVQAYTLTGVVQRSMYRLRADVETKLNALPLRYVDRTPRGDLLSRVTNDIDNLSQGLQQTISQVMTNTFMLLGTIVMMLTISPLLALVAILLRIELPLAVPVILAGVRTALVISVGTVSLATFIGAG